MVAAPLHSGQHPCAATFAMAAALGGQPAHARVNKALARVSYALPRAMSLPENAGMFPFVQQVGPLPAVPSVSEPLGGG